jgi:hypothetical protein
MNRLRDQPLRLSQTPTFHAEQFELATRVSSRPDLLMSAFGLSLKIEHCVL